jgi:hypothetical protein
MRPAIEVWRDAKDAWFGLGWEHPNADRAAAVIEADRLAIRADERAKVVAEIVAELRNLDGQRDESNLLGWAANHIEAKFGGGDD